MLNLRGTYNPNMMQKAFRHYLKLKYQGKNSKSVSTKANDAFFLFRHLPEDESWNIVVNFDDTLVREKTKKLLIEDLLYCRRKPKSDASGYCRAILELNEFLKLVILIEDSRLLKPRQINIESED